MAVLSRMEEECRGRRASAEQSAGGEQRNRKPPQSDEKTCSAQHLKKPTQDSESLGDSKKKPFNRSITNRTGLHVRGRKRPRRGQILTIGPGKRRCRKKRWRSAADRGEAYSAATVYAGATSISLCRCPSFSAKSRAISAPWKRPFSMNTSLVRSPATTTPAT